MNLTAEELSTFVEVRKGRVLDIVEPGHAERALLDVRERIWKRLADVPDEKSLDRLLEVEAVDFALRPFYSEYCGDHPDGAVVEQLFSWRNRFVEAQIRKTIRLHLSSRNAGEIEAVMADVMGVMWERRQTFERQQGPFVPWARGIALNRARSYRPHLWREVSIDADPERPLEVSSDAPSPEYSAGAGERVAEGPPPESFVEILRMVQESEPHEAVAFLFNRYLDMKPSQIARDNRDLSLPDALAEVIRIVRARYPEIASIDTFLAPLVGRVSGMTQKFGQYAVQGSALKDDIGRWVERVTRSIGRKIEQMGKQFLRCVCDLPAAVHEIVCFLWIRLLYKPPVALQQVAHRELMPLVEMFHEGYSRRELLSWAQIEWSTAPLRKRILSGRSLNDFGGSDLYGSIRRWCDHIDSLITSACAESMLGYVYLVGSLRKGRSS